ncbi:hypothetical protein C3432_14845 [Citrobacter amalonaticus]|uniref:Uncharacterized protein n=1 Tax=Citrobacter amalonaticus TaxID=35703 RepID=A0A2S4RWK1_CITAM|nr:hypothetical protein C3432_14845 [Citrobacter amalonaticus]POT75203.1 hypothetical protein C3436_15315 [Citrobacter amalonaticus]POU64732.1 hypothetical protein C3430_16335 [Citrobacter amalonaticus]POV04568.1 hypothetical protein C3424_15655 [Citrobacter amalonaticus]
MLPDSITSVRPVSLFPFTSLKSITKLNIPRGKKRRTHGFFLLATRCAKKLTVFAISILIAEYGAKNVRLAGVANTRQ